MVDTEGSGLVVGDGGKGEGGTPRGCSASGGACPLSREGGARSPFVVPRDAFPEKRLPNFPNTRRLGDKAGFG